jgi:glycosyltransferase involved in cell wall biosynthesis
MGIDAARMRPIYPGIELPPVGGPRNPAADFELLRGIFKSLRPDVPIVTFLGRQDAEKGIDLLLYAAKLLQQRGVPFQLLCVGGSSFGQHYNKACEQIAEHLRLAVFWKRRVSDEVRSALYRASRFVVYPSIHREPFGMVAAEAMSHGTPVLVPDHGGITEVITHAGRRGGITFKSWDTADLAEQLHKLLTDDALHTALAADARAVAENFSVDRMTDRVLEHMGIAGQPRETVPPSA